MIHLENICYLNWSFWGWSGKFSRKCGWRTNIPFMNRNLQKTHMKRNCFQNWFLKRDLASIKLHIINTEIIVCLLQKIETGYLSNGKRKDIRLTNNTGELWHLLSDELKSCEEVSLVEGDKIVSYDEKKRKHFEQVFLWCS